MADRDDGSEAPEGPGERTESEFPQVFGAPPQDDAGEDGAPLVPPDEPLPGRAPEAAEAPPAEPSKEREAGTYRLLSLDAFRGLTILGMILVNNMMLDDATPAQLVHAPWNGGVHFADMVFPWFLLIAGVSVPFAAASHRRKRLSGWQWARKALKRALTLLLLGCLLTSSLAHRPVFGLGVLQLIGLSYLVAALFYWLSADARLTLAGLFLVGYWALIRFVPVPGQQPGLFLEEENIIRHLNQAHLQRVNLSGLLSVVPTSALVLIGTGLGDILLGKVASPQRKAALVVCAGAGLMVAGWLWNLDLPFNKPVWTPSYILYAAGWGALVLGVFYLVADVRHRQGWTFPLVVLGSNAVLAYVLPILVKVWVLQGWTWVLPDGTTVPLQQALLQLCIAHAGRIPGGWLYTLSYLAVWWVALLYFYRKGIFVRA